MRSGTASRSAHAFDREARHAGPGRLPLRGLVYDYATINDRVDRLVHGLVRRGVRPGDHVGVLMETRPTALALVVAINRIGAVAVLLRPDGEPPARSSWAR